MYIAPGQGQITPWAQNIFLNINLLSVCLFLASFRPFNNIFLLFFFPFKCMGDLSWPCRKIGQCHHRAMIYINFVELHCQMLHTKFQYHRPSGSEKVQVGKDQEKAQSERDSHSKKTRWEKTKLTIRYLYHETYCKPNEQLFSQ